MSVSGEINHHRSPLVLDSDMGWCCHHFSSVYIRRAKLRPVGRLQPADQFNPTRQIPCAFFSSATFPTVDSSATALTFACNVNRTVSGSSGQAVANSVFGSKRLATPGLVYMNCIDSHSRVEKDVKFVSCRINRLLFADDLVLL